MCVMFASFLEKHQILSKTLAVAVSGGADSLALALMADDELRPLGYHLVALTVDHGLRPSSADEARYVADIMQKHGIEHHILRWEGPKPRNGVEEAARLARYALIAKWCQSHGVEAVFLAHHLEDQAETFLMRLQRGSGLDGLCAMSECSQWPKVKLLRPLLQTPPQQMKDYLQARDICWVEDESNQDSKLLRVKIRQALPALEKLGITARVIAQTCDRLQKTQAFLHAETEHLLHHHFETFQNFAFACPLTTFLSFPPEMQYRLLIRILSEIGTLSYPPRAERVLALLARFLTPSFKSATLGHCQVTLCGDHLYFLPESAPILGSSQSAWKAFLKTHRSYQNRPLPAALRYFLVSQNKTPATH